MEIGIFSFCIERERRIEIEIEVEGMNGFIRGIWIIEFLGIIIVIIIEFA